MNDSSSSSGSNSCKGHVGSLRVHFMRDNCVVKRLAKKLGAVNCTVYEQLHLTTANSFMKPDLIAADDENALIIMSVHCHPPHLHCGGCKSYRTLKEPTDYFDLS